MKIFGLLLSLTLFPGFAAAQSLTCTTEAGYKPAEGMKAEVKEGMVTLTWPGEDGAQLRASFAIENGQPIVKELAARQGGGLDGPRQGSDTGISGDDRQAPHLVGPARRIEDAGY